VLATPVARRAASSPSHQVHASARRAHPEIHTHTRTYTFPTIIYIITVFFPERGLGARGRFLRDFYEIIIITVSFTESYVVVERRIDGCYVVRCFELEERGNSKTVIWGSQI